MKQTKKRLALFLCLLLTVPTILGCLPMASLRAEAATDYPIYLNWIYGVSMGEYDSETGQFSRSFEIEAGQKASIADMVYFYQDTQKYLSDVRGEKYKSSKTSVATITSDGVLTAKKAGTTDLTVTYKGTTATCKVKVVKAGALGSTSSKSKALKKLAAKLDSYKTITSGNRYAASQLRGQIVSMSDAQNLSIYGFKVQNYSNTGKLVVPEMLRFSRFSDKIDKYAMANNPVGTVQAKWFQIKSVTSKKGSKTFTINLKSKVNATQIYAIKEYYSADDYITNDQTARFPIYLVDRKTGFRYHGWGVVKEKSDKITVTMDYLKLQSKKTYRLVAIETWDTTYGWTKGRSFSVK